MKPTTTKNNETTPNVYSIKYLIFKLSKLPERLVAWQLVNYLSAFSLLPELQYNSGVSRSSLTLLDYQ